MGNPIKLFVSTDENLQLCMGEMVSVKDKERKSYTLKYESVVGNLVNFKLMGRGVVKNISIEKENVFDTIRFQYKKIEKVLKF